MVFQSPLPITYKQTYGAGRPTATQHGPVRLAVAWLRSVRDCRFYNPVTTSRSSRRRTEIGPLRFSCRKATEGEGKHRKKHVSVKCLSWFHIYTCSSVHQNKRRTNVRRVDIARRLRLFYIYNTIQETVDSDSYNTGERTCGK